MLTSLLKDSLNVISLCIIKIKVIYFIIFVLWAIAVIKFVYDHNSLADWNSHFHGMWSDDDIYSLYWFISINWFKKQSAWRCSRKKVLCLYFRNSQENLKVFTNNWAEIFFLLKFWNFVSCPCSTNLFSNDLVFDLK